MKTLLFFLGVIFLFSGIESEWIEISSLEDQMITVQINGYVKYPGYYQLERGSTIQDALNMAGLNHDSDLRFINGLQLMHDQDVLTVSQIKEDLIYLNSASLEELCTLPGIGISTAQNIIDYRSQHLFQSIEELLEVKGIGEKKYEALKGKVGL